jgi:hypothetical protein
VSESQLVGVEKHVDLVEGSTYMCGRMIESIRLSIDQRSTVYDISEYWVLLWQHIDNKATDLFCDVPPIELARNYPLYCFSMAASGPFSFENLKSHFQKDRISN